MGREEFSLKRDIFEKPEIQTARDDLLVFFCTHNEAARLPYFLDYYRQQGVRHFFAIDNNSDDGSAEFLKSQDDVHYFFTSESYVSSRAGRLWTTELANHYGNGRWCLTLDVDELFVFPGIEKVTIAELTRHLDDQGARAVFCIFLDMYSDRPLSETVYQPGTPFLSVCGWFEKDTYRFHPPRYFPQLQIFGGPRQRQFWEGGGSGNGPSMRKTPLVKWGRDVQYYFSTHSLTPVPLASFTGALLHFKFFSSFKELARREVKRGDRVQMDDYRKYLDKMKREEILFHRPESIHYDDSLTLLRHGVTAGSRELEQFLHRRIAAKYGRRAAESYRKAFNAAMTEGRENAPPMTLDTLPVLWELVNNRMIWQAGNMRGGGAADGSVRGKFKRLINTSSMKRTYRLRRWLFRKGWLRRDYIPEKLSAVEMTPDRLTKIYESFWWEIWAPLRFFRRLRHAVRWHRIFRRRRK